MGVWGGREEEWVGRQGNEGEGKDDLSAPRTTIMAAFTTYLAIS